MLEPLSNPILDCELEPELEPPMGRGPASLPEPEFRPDAASCLGGGGSCDDSLIVSVAETLSLLNARLDISAAASSLNELPLLLLPLLLPESDDDENEPEPDDEPLELDRDRDEPGDEPCDPDELERDEE